MKFVLTYFRLLILLGLTIGGPRPYAAERFISCDKMVTLFAEAAGLVLSGNYSRESDFTSPELRSAIEAFEASLRAQPPRPQEEDPIVEKNWLAPLRTWHRRNVEAARRVLNAYGASVWEEELLGLPGLRLGHKGDQGLGPFCEVGYQHLQVACIYHPYFLAKRGSNASYLGKKNVQFLSPSAIRANRPAPEDFSESVGHAYNRARFRLSRSGEDSLVWGYVVPHFAKGIPARKSRKPPREGWGDDALYSNYMHLEELAAAAIAAEAAGLEVTRELARASSNFESLEQHLSRFRARSEIARQITSQILAVAQGFLEEGMGQRRVRFRRVPIGTAIDSKEYPGAARRSVVWATLAPLEPIRLVPRVAVHSASDLDFKFEDLAIIAGEMQSQYLGIWSAFNSENWMQWGEKDILPVLGLAHEAWEIALRAVEWQRPTGSNGRIGDGAPFLK